MPKSNGGVVGNKFCSDCGSAIRPSAKFCSQCGRPQGTADGTSTNVEGDRARDDGDRDLTALMTQAEELRFGESRYLIREKHWTRGSRAWVLDADERVLLFARETEAYSREFFFYVNEEAAEADMAPLFHVQQTASGPRGLVGSDFVIHNWRWEEIYSISRTVISLNRTWNISTADGRAWGRAFEGAGTSIARRVPGVSMFTVLSMQVERSNGRRVANFSRKRMSLGDTYMLDISDDRADRRLLIALGVLFETIHD